MIKLIVLFFTAFPMMQPLFAESEAFHVDVRVAAFYPTYKLMRQIYGNWQVNYEIEAAKLLYPTYEIWGNISWLETNGKSYPAHLKSKFENTNLSFGAKFLCCLNSYTHFYLGAGLNGAFVNVHNRAYFVKRHVYKNGVGGVFKAGIYCEPMESLFLEVFTDYLYQKIHFQFNAQIGGIKMGGGIGYSF